MSMPPSLRRVFVTALAFVFATSIAIASKTYDVYLIAGQSNADGRGYTADLTGNLATYAAPQAGVELYYANPTNGDPVNPTYRSGWVDLAPGYSVGPGFSGALPSDRFGFELSLGRALAAHDPERAVAIIKVSRGGTNLANDWDPDGNANYMWQTFARTVPAALSELTAIGDQARIRGIFWHQGESDGGNQTYQNDLVRLIAAVRSLVDRPNLPFVIGELERDHLTPTVASRTYQLAAMADVAAADANAFLVSSADLATYDGTHFTSASYITFGERFAAALPEWLYQPYTVTFDPQGGTPATPATITVNYDLPYGALPVTERPGHSLLGWFTAPVGGTRVTPETFVSVAQDHTLHARWNATPSISPSPPAAIELDTFIPWTPAQLAPAAWFDVTDTVTLTTNLGHVSAWADKSGHGHHATQATPELQPTTGTARIGGLDTVSLRIGDGSAKQFLSVADAPGLDLDSSGGVNIFAVFRYPGFANNGSTSVNAPLAKGNMLLADTAYGIRVGANNALAYKAGTEVLPGAGAFPDQPLLFSGTRDDSTRTGAIHVNGNLGASVTHPTAILSDNAHPLLIGRDLSTGRYSDVDFGEILIVGGSMSDSERQQIEGYLAHKWSLASSLPAAHPHRAQPPGDFGAVTTLAPVVIDAEGDPLTHLWSFVSGPAPVSFGDASAASTTATFFAPGIYTLRLTSSDGLGSTSGDVVITVDPSTPPDPFSAWAGEAMDESGAALTFTGDANRDGIADGLAWLLGTTSPTTPASALLPALAADSDTLTLRFTMLAPPSRGPAVVKIEYSRNLADWTSLAVPDSGGTHEGVDFAITPDGHVLQVQATFPGSLADDTGRRLFLRLRVEKP